MTEGTDITQCTPSRQALYQLMRTTTTYYELVLHTASASPNYSARRKSRSSRWQTTLLFDVRDDAKAQEPPKKWNFLIRRKENNQGSCEKEKVSYPFKLIPSCLHILVKWASINIRRSISQPANQLTNRMHVAILHYYHYCHCHCHRTYPLVSIIVGEEETRGCRISPTNWTSRLRRTEMNTGMLKKGVVYETAFT